MTDPTPIYSVKALAGRLEISARYMEDLARRAPRLYAPFDLRRRESKKWRHIDNPRHELKVVQERISATLLGRFPFPETMLGGIRGRSALANAALHVGQRCVINLDLKDCFPRLHDREVFGALKANFRMSDGVAGLITRLTTLHHRLPQGAPSSSPLANLAMLEMHAMMAKYARERGLVLSQFVDDVTISGTDPRSAIQGLIEIAARFKKEFSHRKLKIQDRHERQSVTGYVVNERVSVPREVLESTRQMIGTLAAEGAAVTKTDLLRVGGRLAYIDQACPERAEKLIALARSRLPGDALAEAEQEQGETRPCSSYRRHRSD